MFKNIAPIYLYIISVVCFVIANLVREQFLILYYILLITGVLIFFLFFKKIINKK